METPVYTIHNASTKIPNIILVAEDHADLREYICSSLKPKFNVIGIGGGDEAWELAIKHLPDLIIADIMMPGMDGITLCKKLKKDRRTNHIPVIMLTGKADIESKIEGLHSGADDYIGKPFYMEELQARIDNLIDAHKTLKEKYRQTVELIQPEIEVESSDQRFMRIVMRVVETHMDDPQFGVSIFAQEVGLSTIQLYRKLCSSTGLSPNDFIREQRLLRSASLLEKKAGNVAEIAYSVGFNTLSYFSKCFREKFGCTPKEYARTPA